MAATVTLLLLDEILHLLVSGRRESSTGAAIKDSQASEEQLVLVRVATFQDFLVPASQQSDNLEHGLSCHNARGKTGEWKGAEISCHSVQD